MLELTISMIVVSPAAAVGSGGSTMPPASVVSRPLNLLSTFTLNSVRSSSVSTWSRVVRRIAEFSRRPDPDGLVVRRTQLSQRERIMLTPYSTKPGPSVNGPLQRQGTAPAAIAGRNGTGLY